MGTRLSGVGYGRPPKEHCWKKGQSGNPKGRPPGHRNLAAALTAILHERVSVAVEGEAREMTRLEAVTCQLVDRAVAGDPRLIRELLAEIHKNEAQAERDASGQPLGEADREVMEALYIRLRREAVTGGSR
ncbi:MAG TPA: DUF5681 domain-containing protein [Rhizomicrobium sp.]|jgi:hypothetical protein|nr:DUF5681 domain-containing protein [Rhizomicrobium sp.]